MPTTPRRVPTTITLSPEGWETAWRLSQELAEQLAQQFGEESGRHVAASRGGVPWSRLLEGALLLITRSRRLRAGLVRLLLRAGRVRKSQQPRRKVAPRRAACSPPREPARELDAHELGRRPGGGRAPLP